MASEETFILPSTPVTYGPGVNYKLRLVEPDGGKFVAANPNTFTFSTDSRTFWIPSESFFRIRMVFTNAADGKSLAKSFRQYFKMFPIDCAVERVQYELGSQIICVNPSQNAQIAAFKRRLTTSKASLRSTVSMEFTDLEDLPPEGTNAWWEVDPANETNVSTHANSMVGTCVWEFIWRPTLGIMNIGHGIPGGQHRFTIKFFTRWIDSMIASGFKNGAGILQAPSTIVKGEITHFSFYAATAVSPVRFDNLNYILNTENVSCQIQNFQAGGGLKQLSFSVRPSLIGFGVAIQNNVDFAEAYTVPASVLNILEVPTGKGFVAGLPSRLWVSYGGRNYPENYMETEGTTSTTDSFVENPGTNRLWVSTLVEAGMFGNVGGSESSREFLSRGAIFYFRAIRDGSDQSTQLVVNFELGNQSGNTVVGNCLLFQIYSQSSSVSGADGSITGVNTMMNFGAQNGSGASLPGGRRILRY